MIRKLISTLLILTFTFQSTNAHALRARSTNDTPAVKNTIAGAMHEGRQESHKYFQLKYDKAKLAQRLALLGVEYQNIKPYQVSIQVPRYSTINVDTQESETKLFDAYFDPIVTGLVGLAAQYQIKLNQNNLKVFLQKIFTRLSPERRRAVIKKIYQSTMGKTLYLRTGNIGALSSIDLDNNTIDMDASVLLAIKNPICIEMLLATILGRDFFGYICGIDDEEQLNINDAESTIAIFDLIEGQNTDATLYFQNIFRTLYDIRIRQVGSFSYIDCLQANMKKKEYAIPDLIGGRYKPLAVLGEGGMGIVFLAKNQETGSKVAIKITKGTEEELARFIREVVLIKDVNHPYVITIESFSTYGEGEDKHAYYAMRYCPWPTLKELLDPYIAKPTPGAGMPSLTRKNPEKYSVLEYMKIIINVLKGLEAIHKQELVHRDLKPENIKFDRRTDSPIIMDFGLVKSLKDARDGLTTTGVAPYIRSASGKDSGSVKTMQGVVMGTPQFMSPEQARDSGSVDTRSDLFAMGAILYQMLTGELAFDGNDIIEILHNVTKAEPIPPSKLNQAIDNRLEEIILKSLDKDINKRYQTAEEMRQALENYVKIAESGRQRQIVRVPGKRPASYRGPEQRRRATNGRPVPPVEAKKPTKSKTTMISASIAAGVVALTVGIVALVTSGKPASKQKIEPAPKVVVNPQPPAEDRVDKQIKESEALVANKLQELQTVIAKSNDLKKKIGSFVSSSSHALQDMQRDDKNKTLLDKKAGEIRDSYEKARSLSKGFDAIEKEAAQAQKGLSEEAIKLETLLSVKGREPARDAQREGAGLVAQVGGARNAANDDIARIKGNLQAAEELAKNQMSEEDKRLATIQGFVRELNEKLEAARARKEDVDLLAKKIAELIDALDKKKNITGRSVADISAKPTPGMYETAEGILKVIGDLEELVKSLPGLKEKAEKSQKDAQAVDDAVKVVIASIKEKGLSEQEKEFEGLLAQIKESLDSALRTSQDLPKEIQKIESLIADLKGHVNFATALVKIKALEDGLKEIKAALDKGKNELGNIRDYNERNKKRTELLQLERELGTAISGVGKIREAVLKTPNKAGEILAGDVSATEESLAKLKESVNKATSSSLVWKWDGKSLDGWSDAKPRQSYGVFNWKVEKEGVLKGASGGITLPIKNLTNYRFSFAIRQNNDFTNVWGEGKQSRRGYTIAMSRMQNNVAALKADIGSTDIKYVMGKEYDFKNKSWQNVDIVSKDNKIYLFLDGNLILKFDNDGETGALSLTTSKGQVEIKDIFITPEISNEIKEKMKGQIHSKAMTQEDIASITRNIEKNCRNLTYNEVNKISNRLNTLQKKVHDAQIDGNIKLGILSKIKELQSGLPNVNIVAYSSRIGIKSPTKQVSACVLPSGKLAFVEGMLYEFSDAEQEEMLLHEILATLYPETSHTDHKARYASVETLPEGYTSNLASIQRAICGEKNTLKDALRSFIYKTSIEISLSSAQKITQQDVQNEIISALGLGTKEADNSPIIFSANAFKQLGPVIALLRKSNPEKKVAVIIPKKLEYLGALLNFRDALIVINEGGRTIPEELANATSIIYCKTSQDNASWIEDYFKQRDVPIYEYRLNQEILRNLSEVKELSPDLENFQQAIRLFEGQV